MTTKTTTLPLLATGLVLLAQLHEFAFTLFGTCTES